MQLSGNLVSCTELYLDPDLSTPSFGLNEIDVASVLGIAIESATELACVSCCVVLPSKIVLSAVSCLVPGSWINSNRRSKVQLLGVRLMYRRRVGARSSG